MDLRWYQREAVGAVLAYWQRGGGGSPVVEVPTGGGKSAILGELSRVLVEQYGARVVIATHRAELIRQDAGACRAVWTAAPVGIYSAGVGERRTGDAIIVCGVQSVWRKPGILGPRDVLIVDEAHLVSPTASTMYRRLIDGLRERSPDMRLVGLTATPYRLGQGMITEGDERIFDTICYRVPVRRLVDEGYLAPLVSGGASAAIDVSNARTHAGEWVLADLELAADIEAVTSAVVDDVVRELSAGRTSALLFGTSVKHAAGLRNALQMAGVGCELITGETDKTQRARTLEAFRTRRLQAIASCDVLTTGFDAPCVDVIALVRPTQSAGLYVQMVGRGMRTATGKRDCVVLDYGGNIARHGPVDDVKVKPRTKRDGDGKAPVKMCPSCCAEVPASSSVCLHCDHEFPPPEKKANTRASKLSPLSSTTPAKAERKRIEVGDVRFAKHVKRDNPDAPPTLRVEYWEREPADAGPMWMPKRVAQEWVCVEHPEGSWPRMQAQRWWRDNGMAVMPYTVDNALALLADGVMPVVEAIEVEPDGKYTRVVRVLQRRPREPGSDDVHESEQESMQERVTTCDGGDDELPF